MIIPTYNRPDSLRACLDSLKAQLFGETWEVIVVDDGGRENLTTLTGEFEESLNLTVIRQENAGPAAARNRGVQSATGRYIAFLDDDCEPDKDWLALLMKEASEGNMIGGRTINKLQSNLYSETNQALVSFLYGHFNNSPWYFFTSNNFLVDRKTFLKVGGFDETFKTSAGEDREFCLRWRYMNYKMSYCQEAIILHSHFQTFSSFWKMHLKYGRAAYLFDRKTRQMRTEPLKPKLSFYVALFGFVWRHESSNFKRRSAASFLILISQLATFLGFLKTRLITLFEHT